MDRKESPIKRSALFVLTAQLEGFCNGLRQISSLNLQPEKLSIDLFKNIFQNFKKISSGNAIDNFPEIKELESWANLLIYAETLRSTMMAFLTPEETEEHNKSFGFKKRDESED